MAQFKLCKFSYIKLCPTKKEWKRSHDFSLHINIVRGHYENIFPMFQIFKIVLLKSDGDSDFDSDDAVGDECNGFLEKRSKLMRQSL